MYRLGRYARMGLKNVLFASAVLAAGFAALPATADPWARPGDVALRHDLRLLADAGLLRAPVNAWPIPWASIAVDLGSGRDPARLAGQDPETVVAYARVTARLNEVRGLTGLQPNLRVALRSDDFWLRNFEDTPREESEVRAGVSWLGDRLAMRAQLSYTPDALDGDSSWRGDGSYLAGILGNQILYAGALEQWWGPGHDDTLMLSTNARPVAGLGLQRNVARPSRHPWLAWLGPWTYALSAGFLESNREVPDARLLAYRFGFRPQTAVEFGVSRMVIWCGKGRDCDGAAVWDALTSSGESGQALTAFDARWQSPFVDGPWAIYGQAVAQDKDHGFSSNYFGQLGIETWGSLNTAAISGSWRAHLEYSNTLAKAWQSEPQQDLAYNHPIYGSGFRYKSRALGAALDGDGEVLSAGVTLVESQRSSWNVLLRHGTLNRRGDGEGLDGFHSVTPQELRITGAQFSHRRAIGRESLRLGTLSAGVGVRYADNRRTGDSGTDAQAFLQWTWDFSGL